MKENSIEHLQNCNIIHSLCLDTILHCLSWEMGFVALVGNWEQCSNMNGNVWKIDPVSWTCGMRLWRTLWHSWALWWQTSWWLQDAVTKVRQVSLDCVFSPSPWWPKVIQTAGATSGDSDDGEPRMILLLSQKTSDGFWRRCSMPCFWIYHQ